jgi:hypothetical protein
LACTFCVSIHSGAPPQEWLPPTALPGSPALAEFNRDGKLDVATADWVGNGTFSQAANFPAGWNQRLSPPVTSIVMGKSVRQLVTPLIPSSLVAVDFIHNGKNGLGSREYLFWE